MSINRAHIYDWDAWLALAPDFDWDRLSPAPQPDPDPNPDPEAGTYAAEYQANY